MLTADGFDVEYAENGKEGIEKVSSGFDLVVLDLQMPVMDGFEFLDELDSMGLESSKAPKILIYSSLVLDEVVRKKLQGRSLGIIDKNIINSQSELEVTIKDLLNN